MDVSLKNVFHHGQDFHTTTQKSEAKVYVVNNEKIIIHFLALTGARGEILICIAEVILLGEGDSYRVSPDDRRVIRG